MVTTRKEVEAQSSKVINLFKDKHNLSLSPLEILIQLRLSNLSLPALVALAIVDSNHHGKYPMVYVGEVQGMFMSYYTAGSNRWEYSSVAAMLNKLVKRGYLNKERHGRYMAYGMTRKGITTLRQLGMDLTK